MEYLDISIENNFIFLSGFMTKNSIVIKIDNIKIKAQNIANFNNIFDLNEKTKLLDNITIDIKNISKIDTVGLAVLMGWIRFASNNNKQIIFININDKINYACKLYGITDILPVSL